LGRFPLGRKGSSGRDVRNPSLSRLFAYHPSE
jgi:hypothetical protein